jgi:N-acetylmuramoyl-L-alanine amidase
MRSGLLLVLALLVATVAMASPADDLRRADDFRRELSSSAAMRRQRTNWEKGIELYAAIARKNPKDAAAPKALYEAGNLTMELSRYSGFRTDLAAARDLYRQAGEKYPKSPLADDALYKAGLAERALGDLPAACAVMQKVVSAYPKSGYLDLARKEIREIQADPAFRPTPTRTPAKGTTKPSAERSPIADAKPTPLPASSPAPTAAPTPTVASGKDAVAPTGPVEGRAALVGAVSVEAIRFWANPEYTRVVIDLSGASQPTHFAVAGSEEEKLPPRIVIDIPGSTLKDPKLPPVDVGNGLLRNTADQVRVVLDLESVGSYHAFTLPNPNRIVVDVFGAQKAPGARLAPPPPPALPAAPPAIASAPSTGTAAPRAAATAATEEEPPTLAQQLGLTVRRVILDPGHGGKDPGAIGPSGLKEKDVVLDIGLRLRSALRERYGLEVIMTRETDVFLELPERTAIANTKEGDIFISIHANASRRRAASGVETYYLNLASSRESAETAARENMTSVAGIGDLNKILAELLVTTKVVESSKLARTIQGSVVGNLRKRFGDIQDLGVKQAPFYVLIGALMPSVLAEVSFISNKTEEKRLAQEAYRAALAESLAEGIGGYLRRMGKG